MHARVLGLRSPFSARLAVFLPQSFTLSSLLLSVSSFSSFSPRGIQFHTIDCLDNTHIGGAERLNAGFFGRLSACKIYIYTHEAGFRVIWFETER